MRLCIRRLTLAFRLIALQGDHRLCYCMFMVCSFHSHVMFISWSLHAHYILHAKAAKKPSTKSSKLMNYTCPTTRLKLIDKFLKRPHIPIPLPLITLQPHQAARLPHWTSWYFIQRDTAHPSRLSNLITVHSNTTRIDQCYCVLQSNRATRLAIKCLSVLSVQCWGTIELYQQ